MRPLYIVFFSFIIAGIAFAAKPQKVGEYHPIPDEGFADVTALEKWASESSFGGGGVGKIEIPAKGMIDTSFGRLDVSGLENIEIPPKEVCYSIRCVTSGIPTMELIFWMKKQGRFMPCIIIPLRMVEYRVEHDGDDVVVKGWLRGKKQAEEVFRVKKTFFTETVSYPR